MTPVHTSNKFSQAAESSARCEMHYTGTVSSPELSPSTVFSLERVLPNGEECYDPTKIVSTQAFEAFLVWLIRHFQVVPLPELLGSGRFSLLPGKKLCALTFDGGWRDTYQYAFPLLAQHKLTATVFVPVRLVGTQRRLWEERLWLCFRGMRRDLDIAGVLGRLYRYFPWCPQLSPKEFTLFHLTKLLSSRPTSEANDFVDCLEEATSTTSQPTEPSFMNWEQIRELQRAGFTIGSNCLEHTILTQTAPELARDEIRQSRYELAERLEMPVDVFAYPGGAATPQITADVREAGYALAVLDRPGFVWKCTYPWILPRVRVASLVSSRRQRFLPRRGFYLMVKIALAAAGKPKIQPRSSHDERLRIAFVIEEVSNWSFGGTERQIASLITSLDKRYFQPLIIVLGKPAETESVQAPCDVRFIGPLGGSRRLGMLINLICALRRFRPHFVQTFLIDGTFYGTLAASLSRVPVIIQTRRNVGYWQKLYHKIALRILNPLVDSWECNSRTIARVLETKERIARSAIEILPNVLDLQRFAPPSIAERASAREHLGVSHDAPVFVAVSMLRPVKDVRTIIEAAARVRTTLPDAKFYIIGSGPEHETLRARIDALNLQDFVNLVGAQFDLRPWLSAADIGLLSSRTEGSSNAVLEYKAMGLPCVVSDIPANRELVSGIFFRPGDPASLAQQILWLWAQGAERQRLSEENRQGISQYDGASFQRRASSYYVKLVAEHMSVE